MFFQKNYWIPRCKLIKSDKTRFNSGIFRDSKLLNNNKRSQNLKNSIYPIILTQVRKIIISKMAKPEEVQIVIDENGQPQQVDSTHTES